MLCNDPEFRRFCNATLEGCDHIETAADMADVLRFVCGDIASRAELDTYAAAAAIFHRKFRLPFVAWGDAGKPVSAGK